MTEPRRLGGRFKLISLAGKGASGEVFRALDEQTGATVAVKCLGGKLDDESSEERFDRERRLLQAVTSPYVVRFIESGRGDDGRPFLAVEWLDGVDLARRQRDRPLDGRGVVEVISQVASGLAAIHMLGFVHRDVKPSNIFVSDALDGSVRATVIDLGIAWSPEERALTRQGTMIGTPWYMSPEQILRNTLLTGASDQFALGILAFQLIAGVRPYRGDDALSVVAKIALTDPPRLRDVVPHIPGDIDAIVARAMAKDPRDRYASTGELAEALASADPFDPVTVEKRSEAETQVLSTSGSANPSTMASGERRVVTAVFARFVRHEDATAARATFEKIVSLRGGVSHALLSLAHVGVFGSARSTGDEPQRAAAAALAMLREIPGADIMIATGRTAGGVVGLPVDAVERGARARASSGSNRRIRIDEPTARLLGDAFEIEGDSPASSETPSGAGESHGEKAAREPRDLELIGERRREEGSRTFLGSVSACVGRERELSQLEGLYAEAASEPVARVAIVVAPAGTGKSRLRQELLGKLARRADAPTVLLGRGNAITEGAPFGLLGSAIRALADARENDTPDVQRKKISALVSDGCADRVREALLHIASIDDEGGRPGEDGVLVTDRARAAFDDWISDLATKKPVVIVLEDVQWADAPSVSLVDSALRNLADKPLFVLAIARPEVKTRFPRLFDARNPERMSLAKLTRRASEALVRSVVGETIAEPLLERILARADGNAFFLEELVRSVVGATSAGSTDASFELPDTVLGTVQARLDALGAEAKRIIKAASIFGEEASARGVAEVLLQPDDAANVEGALRGLTAEEIFEERRGGGESTFVFRHALLRDGAYELLLDDDRKIAHQRAGAWLLRRGERDALVIARHFELGEAPERAMPHYHRAAEQALYASDFALAVTCAEKALLAGATGLGAGQLFLVSAEAKRWSGDLQAALDSASRASTLLPLGSRTWFAAMRELIAAHGRLGNMRAIEPLAHRVSETEPATEAVGAKIAALVQAASHLIFNGEMAVAAALVAEVELLAQANSEIEPRARARVHQLRATLAGLTDQPERAIEEQKRALEWFDLAGDQRSGALVRSNLAFAELQVGELERAEATARAALPTAMRLGLESVKGLILQNIGVSLEWQGRNAEARETQTRALDLFVAHKDPRLEGSSRLHLALLALERGDIDEATHQARVVLESGVEMLSIGAHSILAKGFLARGATRESLASARLATDVLERLGAVEEFEILSRVTLAEALIANGETAAAREVVEQARARVEARQNGIRDASLRTRIAERIPDHARLFQLASSGPQRGV